MSVTFYQRWSRAAVDCFKLFGLKETANVNHTTNWHSTATRESRQGRVFIVGAGPGDAELLTVKAWKLLQTADVVLFDWLVNESVLAEIPRHVTREFVGKRCGKHSMPQSEICQRMVTLAQQGKTVVRLKGGDPAVFARTCEETDLLTANHIPFAIVPGITAASGASAFTGIPLTDRRCAQSVRLLTAHLQDPSTEPEWEQVAGMLERETLVMYMGMKRLPLIVSRLQSQGVANTLPVAVVENACCENQRVFTATLSTIVDNLANTNITGPALLMFGHVIDSRQQVSLELLQEAKHVSSVQPIY